jgi:hypothetical protein
MLRSEIRAEPDDDVAAGGKLEGEAVGVGHDGLQVKGWMRSAI